MLALVHLVISQELYVYHAATEKCVEYDWNVQFKPLSVCVFLLQITALIIETLTWFSMIILILLETKVYIRQFRWLVRFGVIYVLVGDIVMLDLLLSVKDYCSRLTFNF